MSVMHVEAMNLHKILSPPLSVDEIVILNNRSDNNSQTAILLGDSPVAGWDQNHCRCTCNIST